MASHFNVADRDIKYIISGSDKWFELQDLHIAKILPEVLTLSEAYVQIYYRNIRGDNNPDSWGELVDWSEYLSAWRMLHVSVKINDGIGIRSS